MLQTNLNKCFTAYAYSVLTPDKVLESGFGGKTCENGEPIDENTLFDLASLTKPIVTATIIAQFIAEERVSLSTKLSTLIQGFDERITIGMLLNHTSGLPAWLPLYNAKSVDDALTFISKIKLEYEPGSKEVYSDLGYIVLGKVIELVSNSLEREAQKRVFDPLGMRNTRYKPDPKRAKIVLTETYDWREWGAGIVHDENCYFLGGITGHAGLFSCLKDLELYACALLSDHKSVFPRRELFLDRSNVNIGGEHSYGWFIKTSLTGSFGTKCSEKTIGHTGFTGTGMWIDFENKIASILLTNRVYFGRHNSEQILRIRRAFNDFAFSKLYLDKA